MESLRQRLPSDMRQLQRASPVLHPTLRHRLRVPEWNGAQQRWRVRGDLGLPGSGTERFSFPLE